MSNMLGRIATDYGIFKPTPQFNQYDDGSMAELFEGDPIKVLFGERIKGLQRPNISRPLPSAIALLTSSGGVHVLGEHGYLYKRDGRYTTFPLPPIRSVQILLGSRFEIAGVVSTSPVDRILAHVEHTQVVSQKYVNVTDDVNPLSIYFKYFFEISEDVVGNNAVGPNPSPVIWLNR